MSGLLKKVAMVGSGNFGCVMASLIGDNIVQYPEIYDPIVDMWVFEEDIDGRKLTEIINTEHENVKYLPGFSLAENLLAVPDLSYVVSDADLLVFCLPHPFLNSVLHEISETWKEIKRDKPCWALSMIKGLDFSTEGPILLTKMISDAFEGIIVDSCCMMGANIAGDVASKQFVETTLGYGDESSVELFRPLLQSSHFHVQPVQEVAGVELCGALKNIVAMATGFSLGNNLGASTYATIMRIGFHEMRKFILYFFPDCNQEIFFLSCGIADLICTCRGGRNSRGAEEFVRGGYNSSQWEQLELDLLNGQKLAGLGTLREVWDILNDRDLHDEFPLFSMIGKISFENEPPENIAKIKQCDFF